MGLFDFVEDAVNVVADAVTDVVDDVAGAVDTVTGGLAGDVLDAVAPLGGVVGGIFGGPIGGALGGAVGGIFGGDSGGGPFDFIDDAIGGLGGILPAGLGDIAGGLLDGGSLIDTVGSIAGGVMGGSGLGDLLGGASDLLGGGDIGGVLGGVLGGDGGLGGLLGGASGIGGLLGGADGIGGILGQATDVLGGLGLGGLGSAATGMIGGCWGGTSSPGGWLDDLPDLGDVLGGGGGFDLPFGLGSLPTTFDPLGPITQAGGSWLEALAGQAGEVAEQIGTGGIFGGILDRFEDLANDGILNPPADLQELLDRVTGGAAPDPDDFDIDTLIGQLPGVGNVDEGGAEDALHQLAQSGGLAEALATLSPDDVTALVAKLVSPASAAGEEIAESVQAQVIDDGLDMTFGDDASDVSTQVFDADGDGLADEDIDPTFEPAMAGADDGGLGGDDFASDDFGGDQFGGDGAAGTDMDAPAYEPEPEPEPSEFSQDIAAAEQVEDSFDSMFEGLE